MNKNRITTLPLLVAAVVVALVVGSFGTAEASSLTVRQVKKIAAKVVRNKATSLSVAHAASADRATTADRATSAASADSVKPNSITGASVVDGSISAADLAPGTLPFIATAHVNGVGNLIDGKHVTSATRTSTGRYTVTFDRDISSCTFVAQSTGSNQSDIWVSASASDLTVDVELPATADTQDDDAFYLIGVC